MTRTRGVVGAEDDAREANKRTVLAFYDAALNRKSVDEAVGHLSPKFVQHNPRSRDGVEGFRLVMDGLAEAVVELAVERSSSLGVERNDKERSGRGGRGGPGGSRIWPGHVQAIWRFCVCQLNASLSATAWRRAASSPLSSGAFSDDCHSYPSQPR